MSEPTLEVLDLSRPDVHTMSAARLLVTECAHMSPAKIDWSIMRGIDIDWNTVNAEENTRRLLAEYADPFYTAYALVQAPGSVIAAVVAGHGGDGEFTQILHAAVHPDARRKKHGTRLLQHIAEQAIAHGNDNLFYDTDWDYYERPDERGFLSSLGFIESSPVPTFEVSAAELLARTHPSS